MSFADMMQIGKIKRAYGSQAADQVKNSFKQAQYDANSAYGKAQSDYSEFFTNPVGTSASVAGGTAKLVAPNKAQFTDAQGNVSEFGWKDGVMNAGRTNNALSDAWAQQYGLDFSPSSTGRYWKNGMKFEPAVGGTVSESSGNPNGGTGGLLYTNPNGMQQTLHPETSLANGLNRAGLAGNILTGTYINDPDNPGKSLSVNPRQLPAAQLYQDPNTAGAKTVGFSDFMEERYGMPTVNGRLQVGQGQGLLSAVSGGGGGTGSAAPGSGSSGGSSGGAFAGGNYGNSNFATPNTAGYNSPMARDQLAFMLNQNTPYMQAANNAGLQTAASRGLLNSSLAAEASQKAMVEAAGPIAQQDADFLQSMEKAAREQGYTLEQYAAKHGYDLERLNSEYGWKSASAQYEADLAYRSNYLQAIANINAQDMNQADKEAAIANLSKIYAESKVVGLVDRVTINPDGTVTVKPGPATPPATGGSDQQAPSTGASTDGWRAYQTRAQMPANDRAIYEARYGTTYEPKDIVWLESAANDIKHKLREYPTGGNYQSKYTGVTYKRADVRNTYDKEMEDRAKAAGIQLNPTALQKVFAWTPAPAPAPESGWGNSGGGN